MLYACLATLFSLSIGLTGLVISFIDIDRYNFGLYLALLSVVGSTVSIAFWIIRPRMCRNPRCVQKRIDRYGYLCEPFLEFFRKHFKRRERLAKRHKRSRVKYSEDDSTMSVNILRASSRKIQNKFRRSKRQSSTKTQNVTFSEQPADSDVEQQYQEQEEEEEEEEEEERQGTSQETEQQEMGGPEKEEEEEGEDAELLPREDSPCSSIPATVTQLADELVMVQYDLTPRSERRDKVSSSRTFSVRAPFPRFIPTRSASYHSFHLLYWTMSLYGSKLALSIDNASPFRGLYENMNGPGTKLFGFLYYYIAGVNVTNLCSVSLHRLIFVAYHISAHQIWGKCLLLTLCLEFILPIWCGLPAVLEQNEPLHFIYNNISQNYQYSNVVNAAMFQRTLWLFGAFTFVNTVINTATFYCLAKRKRRFESGVRTELQLFKVTILQLAIYTMAYAILQLRYLAFQFPDLSFVKHYLPFLADIQTLTHSFIIFAFDKRARKEVMKYFGISQILSARKIVHVSTTVPKRQNIMNSSKLNKIL